MTDADPLLAPTRLLDFESPRIAALFETRGWKALPPDARIGAIYEFVRNEVAFGYNRADDIPASQVLADGFGQCNTKGTLLMALLRRADIRCRLHGFTIHKALQRGVVPELVYPVAPAEILHSWIEVEIGGAWIDLEGFILDARYLAALQRAFTDSESLCGYGAGTEHLNSPPVEWTGADTYIQETGIVRDLKTFSTPDEFYDQHRQAFGQMRDWLYLYIIRHWMNARVRRIRDGRLPLKPGIVRLNHRHEGDAHAA
jgi:transglutaminase-like putative cysteine protease